MHHNQIDMVVPLFLMNRVLRWIRECQMRYFHDQLAKFGPDRGTGS